MHTIDVMTHTPTCLDEARDIISKLRYKIKGDELKVKKYNALDGHWVENWEWYWSAMTDVYWDKEDDI